MLMHVVSVELICLCRYLLQVLLTQLFQFFAVFLLQLQIVLLLLQLLYGVGVDL